MRLFKASSDEEKKGKGCYVITAVFALIGVFFWEWVWPEAIPLGIWDFWHAPESWSIILDVWPLYAFGIITTAIILSVRGITSLEKSAAEEIFMFGSISSFFAGLLEEPAFRWAIFLNAIVAAKISNFLFFGWAGFGITEWIFTKIAGPWVNFITLGHLEPILFGFGWAVGAAVLSSNGSFRDHHVFHGPFGKLVVWSIGIFMFYITFNYGIWVAMIIHFLYDWVIDITRYCVTKFA